MTSTLPQTRRVADRTVRRPAPSGALGRTAGTCAAAAPMAPTWALGLALALGLSGCGGSSTAPLPETTVQINSTNGQQVATAMASAMMGNELEDLSSVFTISLAPGAGLTAAPTARGLWLPPQVVNLLVQAFGVPGSAQTRGTAATTGAIGDTLRTAQALLPAVPIPCGASGTLTVTINDVNNNLELDQGDGLYVAFDDCVDNKGLRLHGEITASYLAVSDGGGGLQLALSMNNLGQTQDGSSISMTGAASLAIENLTATRSRLTFSITETLTVLLTGDHNDRLGLLAGYVESSTYDATATPPEGGVGGQLSSTIQGTMTSDRLGGRFTVSTPEALVQYQTDANPRSGVLKAVGSGSTLALHVLTTEQVRLDVDSNADGQVDDTRTVNWADLI
jgi:hypothetical protein